MNCLFKQGGATCGSRVKCGTLIADCLSNGMDALISNDGCEGESGKYCVTCVPEGSVPAGLDPGVG